MKVRERNRSLAGRCLLALVVASSLVESLARTANGGVLTSSSGPDSKRLAGWAKMPVPASAELVMNIAETETAVTYFPDRVPDNIAVLRLPQNAKDIIVARVRLIQQPVYMVGRDDSGGPSATPLPKDNYFAQLKILAVESGVSPASGSIDVRFGSRAEVRPIMVPYTPDQLRRDYIVVIYVDPEDGERRLAPVPVSQDQYAQWLAEQSAYDVLRFNPKSKTKK